MKKLEPPFLAIDNALAKQVCAWHQTEDTLLYDAVAFTSFALQQGHTCLALQQCIDQPPYNAEFKKQSISVSDWLQHLSQFNLSGESNSPVVLENERLYLRRYWQYENDVAHFIKRRQQDTGSLTPSQTKKAKQLLEQFFPSESDEINWQKVAAANTLLTSLSIIVGGPGTGKTYTVTRLLALLCSLSDSSLTIQLAAPTGKAAQRLAESIRDAKGELDVDMLIREDIPDTAQTLHRLLGVIPNQNAFRRNKSNPMDADVLVVDEVSMVDLPLMAKLFRAIKPSCRVILLGDANQLPSVAAGSVLTDLMPTESSASQKMTYSVARAKTLKTLGLDVPVGDQETQLTGITQLLVSRRFNDASGIGNLARAVISGDTAAASTAFTQFDDINLIPATTLHRTLASWADTHYRPIGQAENRETAFALLKKFRILAAHREGERGVETLNEFIRNRLNTNRETFYKGQPVMVTQNNYSVGLFNGDIGLVLANDEGQMMVWFEQDNGLRPVSLGRLPNVETVYAMTIHKTQGSEFDHVAMILPEAPSPLLTRELLYTGLTRAKHSFVCAGEIDILHAGIRSQVTRWAGLADKLYSKEDPL